MFHQSIRYFRPGKPAIFRKSSGEWASQWRAERLPVNVPQDKAAKSHDREKSFSFGNTVPSGAEPQAKHTRGNNAFSGSTYPSHSVVSSVDPTGRPRPAIMASRDAGKVKPSISPILVQQNIRAHDNDRISQSDAIISRVSKRSIGNQFGVETKPSTREQLTPGVGQPDLETSLHISYAAAALPIAASAGAVRVRAIDEPAGHRGSVPERASSPFNIYHVMRSGAGVRKATPPFRVKTSETTANAAAMASKPFPADVNAPATAPRHSGTDGVRPESTDLNFGAHSPMHSSEDAASAAQPSTLAGELWLDTLSLREWLKSYLTGEMRHASQAVNHLGFSLE
jgi:hypothetical protein